MPPRTPRLLQKRYRMIRLLGSGGLGAVWLCDDLRLPGKQWAVKQLNPPDHEQAERFRKTFEREAAVLAGLRHPHLPVVVDFFEEDGDCYLVMEYVEGENLGEYIRRRGPMTEREAFSCGIALLELLGYLHSQDPPVVFRDLKPENVMRLPDGSLKLVDFGLCRPFSPGARVDTVPSGSVGYAAPEQWEELSRLDGRSDVYSWGATLLYLMTGRRPAALHPLPDPHDLGPTVSQEGAEILARCLQLHPRDRYPGAGPLVFEVEQHLEALGPLPGVAAEKGEPQGGGATSGRLRHASRTRPLHLTRTRVALLLVLATAALLAVFERSFPPSSSAPTPMASARGSGVAPYELMYKANEEKELARAVYQSHRYAKALPMLEKAVTLHPDDAEAQILLQNDRILASGLPCWRLPFIGSMTGVDGADSFSQLHGLAIGQEQVNRQGGIRGRRLVLDLFDDHSSTSRCLEIAETLLKDPRTIVVLGAYNSQRTMAIAPLFNGAHVSLVSAVASSEGIWEAGAYIFSASDSTSRRVRALARFVVTAGYRKVGVVVDETSRLSGEMSRLLSNELQAMRRAGPGAPDVRVVPLPSYQEDTHDFSPQVDAIRREGPDIVFLCDYRAVTTALFARQVRGAGLKTPICSQTVPFTPELVREGGAAVDGLLLPAYFHPDLSTPAVKAFVTAFRKKFGALTPTHLAATTFDALMAVTRALDEDPTREGVRAFLRSSGKQRAPFQGVMGAFATGRLLDARPVWIIEVAGGRYRLLQEAQGMSR